MGDVAWPSCAFASAPLGIEDIEERHERAREGLELRYSDGVTKY
jgi:hypothetical protein